MANSLNEYLKWYGKALEAAHMMEMEAQKLGINNRAKYIEEKIREHSEYTRFEMNEMRYGG